MNSFIVRYSDLVPMLQAAVGPVILISGVGLLLLSMTNRYGRIIDRSRALAEALRKAPEVERSRFEAQLQVLLRRARLARAAITLAVISVLSAASLVIALFLGALFHAEIGVLSGIFFVACMGSLITSLCFLLGEINLSLAALKLEIESVARSLKKVNESVN